MAFPSLFKSCGRVLALGLLVLPAACGGGRTALFEGPDPKAEWKEDALVLPSYPVGADLIPLQVSPAATASFFIDGKTLLIGPDEVVRYTLVVRAAGGAENVSYEGIRCDTAERRMYALGRDGAWAASRNDAWQRISENALNRQHAVLAKDFFCPPGAARPSRAEILRALRSVAPR